MNLTKSCVHHDVHLRSFRFLGYFDSSTIKHLELRGEVRMNYKSNYNRVCGATGLNVIKIMMAFEK